MTTAAADRSSLVLTRLPGEPIVLETSDGPVRIECTRGARGGSQLRFFIRAPRSIRIRRGELEGRR